MVDADLSLVEERLMSDSIFYEELLILEDELIDQYVRGRLSESDLATFEKYFLLSPEHRQKVRFARALSRYVDSAIGEDVSEERQIAKELVSPVKPAVPRADRSRSKNRTFSFWPFQNPIPVYAVAALLLVVIGGLSWMAIRSFQSVGPGRVFEATLVPVGVIREGGEMQTISMPPDTDTVRLNLVLPTDQYRDYGVELLASDGRSVLTQENLHSVEASAKKSLLVDVPAHLLNRDAFRLKLHARSAASFEDIATYTFRVNK